MSKVNISAGRETIESYVGGANNRNKLTFIIPEFQRPYEWSKREVETFLDDIFDFAESDRDEYFLGTVITYLPGDDSIEIVDGQQRITTLFLFLRAVYEYLKTSTQQRQTTKQSGLETLFLPCSQNQSGEHEDTPDSQKRMTRELSPK